jgi:hypothetical protein
MRSLGAASFNDQRMRLCRWDWVHVQGFGYAFEIMTVDLRYGRNDFLTDVWVGDQCYGIS